MADRKISDLTALTAPASGDYLPIVDISEASAANKNKRITMEELLRGAPDGTAAAPSIGFESDPNTGIYSPGADQVAISTGGTGRLFVDSAGNVGVGTSSPSQLLEINGASNPCVLLKDTTNNVVAYMFADDNVANFGSGSAHPVAFRINDTERARIDSSGRLLVGTSTARGNYFNSTVSAGLQVEATGERSIIAAVRDTDTAAEVPVFLLARSRGTAIGSNTVVQSGDGLGYLSYQGNDGSEFVEAARIEAVVDGTPGANDMPGRLVFSTTADGAAAPTERMRITSGGWQQNVAVDHVQTLSSATGAGTQYFFVTGKYSATLGSADSGTQSYIVYTNGNVVNTNNSYGAISDIKLKENIVDASSQWDDLKALKVRNYNFKEGQTHTQIGLVAQEVELVSPGLVSESPDRDEDGNDLGTVTKSVNYSVLYMKAVKALQEAMERIEVLEQRLTDAGIA